MPSSKQLESVVRANPGTRKGFANNRTFARPLFIATVSLLLVLANPVGAAELDYRPACLPSQSAVPLPKVPVAELVAQIEDAGRVDGRCGVVAALEVMVEGGQPSAAMALGDLFAAGRFVARDDDRALQMYQRAADLGDGKGLLRAGDLFRSSAAAGSSATANAYYADALAAGEFGGALRLGEFMAATGNADVALEYFTQAADGGLPQGLTESAALHETDVLGAADATKAEALYREAMAAGDIAAPVGLARLLVGLRRTDEAIGLLAGSGEAGNAMALEALGDLHSTSSDTLKAAAAYDSAAKLGLSSAALKLGDFWRDATPPDMTAALAAYGRVRDDGQLRVGDIYRDGAGVEADAGKAVAAYRVAFAAGSDIAAARLGLMYLDGSLVPRSLENAANYLQYVPDAIPQDRLVAVANALLSSDTGSQRALAMLDRAIANGDTSAATMLGDLYFSGPSRDLSKAEAYYLRSAGGIPTGALMELGDAHRLGTGMPIDAARAYEIYELAVTAGIPEAAMQLGEANDKPGTGSAAIKYFVRATELGVSEAYVRLGELYTGKNGAEVNAKAAVDAYGKAIAAGHAEAAVPLGDLYFDGALLPRDLGEAERAYLLSPEGVPAKAYLDLGLHYRDTDLGRSLGYLEQSLAAGQLQAATALGEIYADGRLTPIDPAKADAYFTRSQALVPPESSLVLGEAYRNGVNVRADGIKAAQYLEAALAGGLKPAALSLGEMYLTGQLVPADPAAALSYFMLVPDDIPADLRLAIGDIYRDGTAGTEDGAAARHQYELALAAGVADAAPRLADLLYDSGLLPADVGRAAALWEGTDEGVPDRALLAVADYYRDAGQAADKAIKYYEAAFAKGDKRAALRLADLFYNGTATRRDLKQAEQYYLQSDVDIPTDKLLTFAGAYDAGDGLDKDGAKAAAYYEAALAAGQTAAILPLAQLYYEGSRVPKNLLRAADLLDQSGTALPPVQLRELGNAFIDGAAAPADPARGAAYLEKALAAGDRTVLAMLGDLYLRGEGVTANLATAGNYLLDAARAGETKPLFSLIEGLIDETVPADPDQGVVLLRRAASEGIPGASIRLSEVLIAAADTAGGLALLEEALARGDMDAGKLLLTYYLDGIADVAPDAAAADRVLALVAPTLDSEQAAYTAVMVSSRTPGVDGARQRMAESFALLSPDGQSRALIALKRGNENVYVYLVQSILVARGYMEAVPSGQLTGPTVRAILSFCRDIGSEATCAAGPMSDGATEVIAGALASSKGFHAD